MEINYPYLPPGRTIDYVSADDRFMREAIKTCDESSTELNHPTGAVVVMNGEIIGRAANKSSLKNKRLIELHKNGLCIRKKLKIKTGQKYWLCPGCAQFRHHAEVRALRDALSRNDSIRGADLYLYGHWWCCKPCWDKMINAGIRHVFLVENARELF